VEEAAALAQDSVLEAVARESPAAAEVRAAQADPEAGAAAPALAVRVVEVAVELMPETCGVRQSRAEVAAERGLVVAGVRAREGALAAELEAELGLVVAGVLAGEGARGAEAAELGSVVAAEPEAAAAALAPPVPVVEVVQEAAHPEALLVQLVPRERRERRLEDG